LDEAMYEIVDSIHNDVNLIWNDWDKDNNGYLDQKETMAFINHTLVKMKDMRVLEQEEFDIIFKKFDVDDNQKITREEMTGFILSLAGF
jgi:Ca2+-binding EF-hand superfamily protein